MRQLNFIALFCIFLVFSLPVRALETDQYRMWQLDEIPIEDSTDVVNAYLNEQLDWFVNEKLAHKKRWQNEKSCPKISFKFLKHFRPNFLVSRLKTLLVKKTENAAYPKKQKFFSDYTHSIHNGFAWPFLMPIAQTVKINGVYLGTDKLDHFMSSARRHLKRYFKARKKGMPHIEAIKKAIHFSLSWLDEKGQLGYWTSLTFSFADLESNYQGMNLGIDICTSNNPILEFNKDKQHWQKRRNIDVRDYVNPLWDEAFNNPHSLGWRWKKVKRNLQENYCELGLKPSVQKIWQTYHKRLSNRKDNFYAEYVRGLIITGEMPNPRPQSLHEVCDYPEGVMEGPKFWDIPEFLLHKK